MPTKKTSTTSKPVDVEVKPKPKAKSKPTKFGGKTFTIELTIPPSVDGINYRTYNVIFGACCAESQKLISKEVQEYLNENK